MTMTIWVGAVAYDPKVVTIWEGMRRYFHDEARLPVEVVLFQSYEAQVDALLAGPDDHAPHIDIGWNTNLAYLQADAWSESRCRPIAMRDTDIGWATKIVAVSGGPIATLADLRNRTLALGSRDSGHAAILPVHFLEREGLVEQRDYRPLRFNSDVARSRGTAALGRTAARRLWIVARRGGAPGLAQASGLARVLRSAAPGMIFSSRAVASHAQLKIIAKRRRCSLSRSNA
jgi:hypothetical protein